MSPIKARVDSSKMTVWILRRKQGAPDWAVSGSGTTTSSFSGRGYEGVGVGIADFADYLSNELQLPVVDETGLVGRYDISTENVERTDKDIMLVLDKLGLFIEKSERVMAVLVVGRK